MFPNAILNETLTLAQMSMVPFDADLMSPFPIASDPSSKNEATHNVLVALTSTDGISGVGEAAPFHGISGDTQETVLQELHSVAPHLLHSPMSCVELEQRLRRHLRFGSSRAAVEMAFLDLLAKKRKEPLYRLLNPKAWPHPAQTDITIPLVDKSMAVTLAEKYKEAGFSRIKVKVGDDRQASFERVVAISDVYRRERSEKPLELLIDANEGFSSIEAIALMRRLFVAHIVPKIFEQPVSRSDLPGLKLVTEDAHQWGTRVYADEAVYTADDARKLAEEQACDGINLKLMKQGGILEALRVVEVAQQHGLSLMIGGMMETRLAMTAAFHMALAVGSVHWYDLDTPLLLEERVLEGGLTYAGPRLALPEMKTGIGVTFS